MADTNFVDQQTVIQADWLNDVNDFVYQGVVPTGGVVQITRDSIAELRLIDKNKYQRAFVFGYYTKGDGGGGEYYYDSADVTSTDNGGTIIVANDGGRWKLAYIDTFSVKQFGAKGDGVADDTTAIQAALTFAGTKGNSLVTVPTGIYLFTSTLTLPSGVRLSGDGGKRGTSGLKSNVLGSPSINVLNGYYQTIEHLNLFHATPASAGTGIQLIDNDGVGTGTDPAQYFICSDVRITQHATGVRIANESTWCTFKEVIVEQCTSAGFSVSNANFTVFENCISDGNDTAWFLDTTSKTVLNQCTAQSSTNTSSAAINVLNCDNVEINSLWTERNQFHNVHVRGTSRFTRITEMLNQGAGTTTASGRGIYLDGTSSNTIIDGGWHGNNATEDITVGSTTTNTFIINPRSASALTFTDGTGTATMITSGQLKFPASPNLSSNANTLDAYAEGSFTPTVIGTTTAGIGTYNSQVGRYTRIGDTVFFHARVNLASHTGAGNMVIGGLPFTSQNTSGLTPSCTTGLISGLTLPANSYISADIQPNTSQITLYSNSTAGGSVSSAALALDTAFVIEISGFYKV